MGIAPGSEEERSKKLFSGPSGQVLNAILESDTVDLKRDDIWVTNSLLCRPLNDDSSVNKIKRELNACRPRLVEEIKQLEEREVIVSMSIPASWTLEEERLGDIEDGLIIMKSLIAKLF